MMASFVPSTGVALAMKACMAARLCALSKLDLPSLQKGFDVGVNKMASFEIALNAAGGVNECLGLIMAEMFVEAGEVMPVLPTPPGLPDLSAASDIAADVASAIPNIEDPLAVFGPNITVTFDGNGIPTLVEFPDP